MTLEHAEQQRRAINRDLVARRISDEQAHLRTWRLMSALTEGQRRQMCGIWRERIERGLPLPPLRPPTGTADAFRQRVPPLPPLMSMSVSMSVSARQAGARGTTYER